MKHIVLFGAGKSAYVLINHLIENAQKYSWKISIGDMNTSELETRLSESEHLHIFQFDITQSASYIEQIKNADIVISMVPAMFHISIAKLCLEFKKHLITPSYINDEMQLLDKEAKEKGLIFLNEMGLDPGIDHMSAMKIIHQLRNQNAIITSFKSYCGGLIAPESDNNPWNYKFTWNPRNVILAGQGKGGIKYLSNGNYKYIPYYNLFKHVNTISINNLGDFDGYPNRDSLKYRSIYGLENIQTMLRGTLRKKDFCNAWDIFVQLGMTDDTYDLDLNESNSYADFMACFINESPVDNLKSALAHQLKLEKTDPSLDKIEWLDLFNTEIKLNTKGSPAKILQTILEQKLSLHPNDKDWVIMLHQFEYIENDQIKKIESSLSIKGKNNHETAMAMTVGLPISIACKLILENKIKQTGVIIPIYEDIYIPILAELETYGIVFDES